MVAVGLLKKLGPVRSVRMQRIPIRVMEKFSIFVFSRETDKSDLKI
jgi:hypothetical protein